MGIDLMTPKASEEDSKLEELFQLHWKLLHRVAFGVLKHEQDAEDVASSAFLKIVENPHLVGDIHSDKTRGLLITITHNKAIDLYRKKKRHPEVPYDDGQYTALAEDVRLSDVAQLFGALPDIQRKVLIMRRVYKLSVFDIAKVLNLSVPNVYKLEYRAKKSLREMCELEDSV